MTATERIVRALGANTYGQAVQLVIQLGTVPLLLAVWGVDTYHDWLIISTVPAYLAASDLGFVSAATNRMSAAAAREDVAAQVTTFRSAWVLTSALSVVVLVLFGGLSLVLAPAHLLATEVLSDSQARWCLCVLAAYAVVILQESLLQGGFRAAGRNATGITMTTTVRLVEAVAAVVVAAAGGGLLGASLALLGGRVVGTAVQKVALHGVAPHLTYGLAGASRQEVRQLWGPSIAFLGLPIGNLITLQGFVLVLAHVASSVALVEFSLVRTMSRFGTQLVGVLNSAVWPELSFAYGRGDLPAQRRLHNSVCAASFFVAVVAGVGLVLVGKPVIHVWTGGRVMPPAALLLLLALDLVLATVWSTSSVLPAATNRLSQVSLAYVLCGLVSLALVPPIVYQLGIAGAGVSMVVCDAVLVPFVVGGSLRMLDQDLTGFLRSFDPRAAGRVVLRRES